MKPNDARNTSRLRIGQVVNKPTVNPVHLKHFIWKVKVIALEMSVTGHGHAPRPLRCLKSVVDTFLAILEGKDGQDLQIRRLQS